MAKQTWLWLAVVLAVWALAFVITTADATTPPSADAATLLSAPPQCPFDVVGILGCLDYIAEGSQEVAPRFICCVGVARLMKLEPQCLCDALDKVQLKVPINVTRGQDLPKACMLPVPAVTCDGLSPSPSPPMSPTPVAPTPPPATSPPPAFPPTKPPPVFPPFSPPPASPPTTPPPSATATYNVVAYGASPDGQTNSTTAFLNAWTAACGSNGPAAIYVPAGSFAVDQMKFSGSCRSNRITIQINGTLVAPMNYTSFGTQSYWMAFSNVQGISINGGTIDGRGTALWACKASSQSCPNGATSLIFSNSKDIIISGLTSINSEVVHVVINSCQGVTVQGINISAPGNSPNTDGIHISRSTDVTITGANIRTGDDCISIGPGTTNLWIERITCGPGHGISIGSLGWRSEEPGVENVTVKSTVFTGTQNGFRIKTWGRPSNGFVTRVVFENALMQTVRYPIIIDQNYCPSNSGCPNQSSGIQISNVTYNNIHGSSATAVAVNFNCSASNHCNGIELQDIMLTYRNEPAESFCKYVGGTVSGSIIPPSCL